MMSKETYQVKVEISPSRMPVKVHSMAGLISPENEDGWRHYLDKLLDKALCRETMDTPEFKAAIEAARKEAEVQQRASVSRERERRLRAMQKPHIDFIPKGLGVDYEREYAVYLQQEVTFEPQDKTEFLKMLQLIGRWPAKSVPQVLAKNRPDAAYAIAITVCRHLPILLAREDLQDYFEKYHERIKRLIECVFIALHDSVVAWNNEGKRRYVNDFISEQIRIYTPMFRGISAALLKQKIEPAFVGEPVETVRQRSVEYCKRPEQPNNIIAQDEKSIIPINADFEARVFSSDCVGPDGIVLDAFLSPEADKIERMLAAGEQMKAAQLAMQLTKSLCLHYISDEHWCYYDDDYSPDYTICTMLKRFNAANAAGELMPEVVAYLHDAWQEIATMESKTGYGIPDIELTM